ncbi:hypothetical protein QBC44DRAFT_309260 [Cladorrhinum sp. PSN332]|nr:hypothetical protein QBC44DRAFT_309260 [Cladorrhinum sp. PSN332]
MAGQPIRPPIVLELVLPPARGNHAAQGDLFRMRDRLISSDLVTVNERRVPGSTRGILRIRAVEIDEGDPDHLHSSVQRHILAAQKRKIEKGQETSVDKGVPSDGLGFGKFRRGRGHGLGMRVSIDKTGNCQLKRARHLIVSSIPVPWDLRCGNAGGLGWGVGDFPSRPVTPVDDDFHPAPIAGTEVESNRENLEMHGFSPSEVFAWYFHHSSARLLGGSNQANLVMTPGRIKDRWFARELRSADSAGAIPFRPVRIHQSFRTSPQSLVVSDDATVG